MVVNPNYEGLDWQVNILLERLLKENDTNVPCSFVIVSSKAMVKYMDGGVVDSCSTSITPKSKSVVEQFCDDLPLITFEKKMVSLILKDKKVADICQLARIAELYIGRYVVGLGAYSFDAVCGRFDVEKRTISSNMDSAYMCGDLLLRIIPLLKNGRTNTPINMVIYKKCRKRSTNKPLPQTY